MDIALSPGVAVDAVIAPQGTMERGADSSAQMLSTKHFCLVQLLFTADDGLSSATSGLPAAPLRAVVRSTKRSADLAAVDRLTALCDDDAGRDHALVLRTTVNAEVPVPVMVIFLFTDIVDSTRLWEAQPAQMAAALARHDALCREVVGERGGRVVKTTGDGLYAVFEDPFEALAAAIELQRGIQKLAGGSDLALKMRCGLHCGAAEARDDDYFGPAVNCAARVMDAAHGGQVLVTQALVDHAERRYPEGVDLLHLGRVRLRGVSSPVDVWQVGHADLRGTFPPLRTLDSIPHNLPRHATSFVGRENQIAEVIAHFESLSRSRNAA